jgi:hypothetical protein
MNDHETWVRLQFQTSIQRDPTKGEEKNKTHEQNFDVSGVAIYRLCRIQILDLPYRQNKEKDEEIIKPAERRSKKKVHKAS